MAEDFGKEPRLPAIPDLRTGSTEQAVTAIKEILEVRLGTRGDKLDRAVTMRDLLNAGLATPGAINGLFPGEGMVVPEIPGTIDPAIPPAPTNLTASGAVGSIIVTWDFVRGYSRLAYFELWRSETDALGSALLIAQQFGTTYADFVEDGAAYYYWVRAVSDAGVGPFNAVGGTLGEAAPSVAEMIDAITGEINDSGLLDQLTLKQDNDGYISGYGLANTPALDPNATTFAILASRFFVAAPAELGIVPRPAFIVQATNTTIGGQSVPAGVYMSSAFIQNGVITSAKIGNLAVTDAKIASLNVAKLRAGALGVSEFIESENFLSGDTGFRITGNGNAELNNAVVRGTIYASAGTFAGQLSAATGTFSGQLSAATGSFSGALSAATGTFKGTLEAVDGTFSGQLSAATGSFSGSLTGATGTFAGALSAATGTFAGKLTATAIDAVSTLNVAGNAITGLNAAEGSNGTVSAGGSGTLCTTSVTMPAGSVGVAIFLSVSLVSDSGSSNQLRVYRNNTLIHTAGVSVQGGFTTPVATTALDDSPVTGLNTYRFELANNSSGPGSNVSVSHSGSSIVVSGAKR